MRGVETQQQTYKDISLEVSLCYTQVSMTFLVFRQGLPYKTHAREYIVRTQRLHVWCNRNW